MSQNELDFSAVSIATLEILTWGMNYRSSKKNNDNSDEVGEEAGRYNLERMFLGDALCHLTDSCFSKNFKSLKMKWELLLTEQYAEVADRVEIKDGHIGSLDVSHRHVWFATQYADFNFVLESFRLLDKGGKQGMLTLELEALTSKIPHRIPSFKVVGFNLGFGASLVSSGLEERWR